MLLAGTARPATGSRSRYMRDKALGQLSVHFETTASDRRTQGHANAMGAGSQRRHRANPFARDIGQRLTPTGMESAGNSSPIIDHQYRHAIGGEDSEYDSWHVSDHPVADSTHAIVVRADRVDAIAVNLLQA